MAWRFGSMHSQVRWACSYLGVMTVAGFFKEAQATLRLEGPDTSRWSIEAIIPTASLETGNALRDEILRGPDFLNAAQFPVITFRSTSVEPGDGDYRVVGDLTVHGATREVALEVHDHGEVVDWLGQRSRVLTAETTVRRTDFQVGPPPRAGELIGSRLRIDLQIELLWEDIFPGQWHSWPQRADARAPRDAA